MKSQDIHTAPGGLATWLQIGISAFEGARRRTSGCASRLAVCRPGCNHARSVGGTRLVPLAPLHQPHNLAAFEAVREGIPDVPQLACFDTSFHRTQCAVAELIPLPRELGGAGVQRYGFHGLSYEYIASVLPGVAPEISRGLVIVPIWGMEPVCAHCGTERASIPAWASLRWTGSAWAPGQDRWIQVSSFTCSRAWGSSLTKWRPSFKGDPVCSASPASAATCVNF